MKKLISLLLAVLVLFTAFGCSNGGNNGGGEDEKVLKIGVILVGDENEGYTYAHMEGIRNAAQALGIKDDQILWKYRIGEDQTCYEAADDLVQQGCTYIFSNSYGHQSYMQQAATDNPTVVFVACTGDTAATSGLKNFKNAFTGVYESRFVSGVVAGMKLAELEAAGKIPAESYDENGNVKIGYVGAFPYAEVVSGYTAYYLGVKSVFDHVVMAVTYTSSWFDITKEGEAANKLMSENCVIIAQHADSTGAPSAVQAAHEGGKEVYSVGYNVSMLDVAPDAALTSATNVWQVYYQYAFQQALNGADIATDYAAGYNEGGVEITALGKNVAAGTAAKVEEVIAAIKAGTLHVFDTSTFTVGGAAVTEANYTFASGTTNVISDGYFHESEYRSAPYFDLRIDGINEEQ